MNSPTLAILGALSAALIATLLSLFYVRADYSIEENYRQYHTVTGAEVICDSSRGSSGNSCIGEYGRGWPLSYGEGLVIKSINGNWVESFSINWNQAFVSYLFWVIPMLGVAAVSMLFLAKERQ